MPSLLKKPSQIRRTIKNVGRLQSILRVLVKHGFWDVVQKSSLSGYLPGGWGASETNSFSTAQRLRMALEELGPTFIKLGQLLASRPDIVPPGFIEEFKKLQDQVPPLPFSQLLPVLNQQYPQGVHEVFTSIQETPLGTASIAQVHRAVLKNGDEVVLKIQKPGIQKIIQEDTDILFFVAELFDKYVPELQLFNPIGLAQEFSDALAMETNFIVEANNVRRFYENFQGHPAVRIPKPYIELSGSHILVLEYMDGRPLTEIASMNDDVSREELMKVGLEAYFAMVFKHGLFHGDLHAGNILVLKDNKLAFIDFGMVGRLSRRVQNSIANMFVALATEDYDRLAYEYIELSLQSIDVNRDEFARDLRLLLSPFFGLSLKSVNMGKMLIDSAAIAFKHRIYLPSELLLFFKSIVTIEGLGRSIKEDFDLLPYVYDFSAEIVKIKYDPMHLFSDVGSFSREISSLMRVLPGEVKNYLRKNNHPDYAKPIAIKDLDKVQNVFAKLAHLVFFSVLVGSLLISGALCAGLAALPAYQGLPIISWVFFGLASFFGLMAFYTYVRR